MVIIFSSIGDMGEHETDNTQTVRLNTTRDNRVFVFYDKIDWLPGWNDGRHDSLAT